MKLKEIVPSTRCLVPRAKKLFAAALVAVAGVSAYEEGAPEEEVVASGEAIFWLGPGTEKNPWEVGAGEAASMKAWADGNTVIFKPARGTATKAGLETITNAMGGASFTAAANAPYFDGVNFASLVRCPVRFLVGSVDEVAPPHAGFAAYNACPSADKEIRVSLGFAHSPSPADRAAQTNWLEDK